MLLMPILVSDVDSVTRTLLRAVLEQQGGHVVLEAQSGAAVIERLSSSSLELLIMDLDPSDMSGLELVKRIRHRSWIPLLVLSGRNAVSERVQALRLGADDFLLKPF